MFNPLSSIIWQLVMTSILSCFFNFNNIHSQALIQTNFIELSRYEQSATGMPQYMYFHDHQAVNLPFHQHQFYAPLTSSTEKFTRYQFRIQYYFNTRMLIHVTLPYWIKQRTNDGFLANENKGVGDVWVGGKYMLYTTNLYKQNPIWMQTFWLGGAIQLPTGLHDDANDLAEIEPHFQAGIGSYSYLFNADYLLEKERWRMQITMDYQLNTTNEFTYRVGNVFKFDWMTTYEWYVGKNWQFAPQIGVQFRQQAADWMNDVPLVLEDTKGSICWLKLGGIADWQNIRLKVDYQLPVATDLDGLQLSPDYIWQLAVQYRFAKKEIVNGF